MRGNPAVTVTSGLFYPPWLDDGGCRWAALELGHGRADRPPRVRRPPAPRRPEVRAGAVPAAAAALPTGRGRPAAHPAGAVLGLARPVVARSHDPRCRLPRPWRALRSVPDLEVGHDYVVIGSIAFSEGTPVLNVLDIREQVLRLVPSD